MKQLRIGLDVGFSAKKRTCGISASRDVLPAYGGEKVVVVRADGGRLYCKKLKLVEALRWLADLKAQGLLDGALIVIDGMVGPNGPPTSNRKVDQPSGSFINRAVAAPVVGGGQKLVQATAELLRAAAGNNWHTDCRFSRQSAPCIGRPEIWETNPTIGMAVTIQMVRDVEHLPSRRRTILVNAEVVRAKSDYYWAAGAGQRVAEVLGVAAVAGVRDHELRASLFCLAVAIQVAGEAADASQCVCVGNAATGTYLLLGPIHPSWEQEVRRIGIIAA